MAKILLKAGADIEARAKVRLAPLRPASARAVRQRVLTSPTLVFLARR